jgi:hypothetical protein
MHLPYLLISTQQIRTERSRYHPLKLYAAHERRRCALNSVHKAGLRVGVEFISERIMRLIPRASKHDFSQLKKRYEAQRAFIEAA